MYLKKSIKKFNISLLNFIILIFFNNTISADYFPRILSTTANWEKSELNVKFVIPTSEYRIFNKLKEENIHSTINGSDAEVITLTSSMASLPNKLLFVHDNSGSMKKNN